MSMLQWEPNISICNLLALGIDLATTIKAYYDSSGKSNNARAQYLTLAGYAGSPKAWDEFEQRWIKALQNEKCAYLHMAEALSLQGEFAKSKGWTQKRVLKLIAELVNECLSPIGWTDFKGEFQGASCTINLTDYRKVKDELAELKEPESICVDFVITIALMSMPKDSNLPFGKKGMVELFFDKNEAFMHKVDRVWRSKPNKQLQGPLRLVSTIAQLDSRQRAGLQAADLLAWSTNRYYTHGMSDPIGSLASTLRVFAAPAFTEYYDYSKLKKEFGDKI